MNKKKKNELYKSLLSDDLTDVDEYDDIYKITYSTYIPPPTPELELKENVNKKYTDSCFYSSSENSSECVNNNSLINFQVNNEKNNNYEIYLPPLPILETEIKTIIDNSQIDIHNLSLDNSMEIYKSMKSFFE
jgi:hypothetical protein